MKNAEKQKIEQLRAALKTSLQEALARVDTRTALRMREVKRFTAYADGYAGQLEVLMKKHHDAILTKYLNERSAK